LPLASMDPIIASHAGGQDLSASKILALGFCKSNNLEHSYWRIYCRFRGLQYDATAERTSSISELVGPFSRDFN
jgi:hypothetical protein